MIQSRQLIVLTIYRIIHPLSGKLYFPAKVAKSWQLYHALLTDPRLGVGNAGVENITDSDGSIGTYRG